jgi:hypothetical protein
MPRPLLPSVLIALASTLALGCDQSVPTQPTDAQTDQPAPVLTPSLEVSSEIPRFDPGNFVRGVNNRFFPLPPGTRFVYVGESDGESERTIIDVTDREKTILGVRVVVVLDRVFQNGALKEKTLDWYAQDRQGNVWYLGEDTKEYENGRVISTAGSWEAGKNGARAGIIMLAHPRVGQAYRQEFAPGVAEDRARVLRLDVRISVPYGTFDGCLKTVEFTPLEPDLREVKFYCPRIGFVAARMISGGSGHEELVRLLR